MQLGNYDLLFEDEFNELNLTDESGNTAWNTVYHYGDRYLNNEDQIYIDPYYKDLGLNPFSVEDGVLTITADHAPGGELDGKQYTSGLITSEEMFAVQYGYFEMSAKMPAGQGAWPAFWLLQSDGDWPSELDVVEVLGHEPDRVHTSAHGRNADGHNTLQTHSNTLIDTSDGFHTYGMDWQEDTITWYVDGVKVYEVDNYIFDHSMHVIANLALGGWARSPEDPSIFPAEMEIDYIRVYQEQVDHDVVGMPTDWQPIDMDSFSTLTADVLGDGTQHYQAWQYVNTMWETSVGGKMYGTWPHHLDGNDLDNYLEGAEGKYNNLDGHGGNDVLKGGAGADHFVLRDGDGNDVILDLTNEPGNHDKIKLYGFHFTHFEDVLPFMTQVGDDVLFRLDEDQAALLKNLQISELSPEQFIFSDSVAAPADAAVVKDVDESAFNTEPVYLPIYENALTSYSDQDENPLVVQTHDNNTTLQLEGNTWKKLYQKQVITEDTTLSFEFKSDTEGEIHGIGMHHDNGHARYTFIQLHGTQDFADFQTDYSGDGDWQQYDLKLSEYFDIGKTMHYLTFINDDDAASAGDSWFRNIRLHESEPMVVNDDSADGGSGDDTVVGDDTVAGDDSAGGDDTLDGGTGEDPVEDPVVDDSVIAGEWFDFSAAEMTAYADQDHLPDGYAMPDANTLHLSGNGWKKFAESVTVQADTVLRFEFKSDAVAEIHGIGLSADDRYSETAFIQLAGSQNYALTGPQYTGGGDWQAYELHLADFYDIGEEMAFLTFINDDDANSQADSWFRNIEIAQEDPVVSENDTFDFSRAILTSYGDQDLLPNGYDLADDSTLHLNGNGWKKANEQVTITEDTILRFEFKSESEGEIHGIGLDNDHHYDEHAFIRLLGTQDYGHYEEAYTAGGDWQAYELQLADYYDVGTEMHYLTFINDDDATAQADSWFRNIEIVQDTLM